MYTYGAITQCVFSVHSIFNSTFDQQALGEASSQNLGPNTLKKHGTKATCRAESPINDNTMEEGRAVEPLKNKQKKE
ncbi:hypothetical protein RHMOL_Rhmol10G0138300 [Rhododendron molle]|uniref:Uncharacterized protein n=1 Tax=Rhododendron molle TaxID=49168 RepID=A0ACC0M281_RHOML|nr:hypothetical protein RHMOL_Rhmol10G0138300 [Rhododendron molle]